MDCVKRDMHALRITQEDAHDRTFWKSRIRAADPLIGKGEEEDKSISKKTIRLRDIVS